MSFSVLTATNSPLPCGWATGFTGRDPCSSANQFRLEWDRRQLASRSLMRPAPCGAPEDPTDEGYQRREKTGDQFSQGSKYGLAWRTNREGRRNGRRSRFLGQILLRFNSCLGLAVRSNRGENGSGRLGGKKRRMHSLFRVFGHTSYSNEMALRTHCGGFEVRHPFAAG